MRANRFSFLAFALVVGVALAAVGGLNYLIDPLWYAHGNQLTGKNFAFNERISKVNLLRRTAADGYDCLILGSSRVTMLRASRFHGQHCFNFALKGAEAPEQLAYGRMARELGLSPKQVYVAVDDFNFVDKKETARRANPRLDGTPNAWHAFFSADVLTFSLMTLAGVSPEANYYDRHYDQQPLRVPPPWQPVVEDKADLPCSGARLQTFREIRALFPEARVTGYAPLMSPWYLLSDVYSRGLLDCTLDAFHEIAGGYDAFLDFGIPSALTLDPALTHDGTHYSPDANDAVAERLQGPAPDIALDVKALGREEYRAQVRARLRAFAEQQGLLAHWKD